MKYGELYEGASSELPQSLREEEGISLAIDEMNLARASDEVRELVEQRMRARSNWKFIKLEAIETGLAQGIEQGLQQGLEQGLQQGLQQALEDAVGTARKLLARGVSREVVLETTGFSEADLDGLSPG